MREITDSFDHGIVIIAVNVLNKLANQGFNVLYGRLSQQDIIGQIDTAQRAANINIIVQHQRIMKE